MIRPANTADVDALVEMGRRFFSASGYSDITAFDAQSFKETVERLIALDDAVLLVVEDGGKVCGMAGAVLYPFYLNAAHKTSQEMFWWVNPEHRGVGGKLFEELRNAVRAKGAQSLSMIALEKLNPEVIGAFYERKGLRPSERSFIGRL